MKKMALIAFAMFASASAFAQDAAAAAHGDKGMYAIGLAIMLAVGAFGATFAQGKVGAAAMEGMARNPQARGAMFVPMILVLALIESLFILTWLIAQGLAGKV